MPELGLGPFADYDGCPASWLAQAQYLPGDV